MLWRSLRAHGVSNPMRTLEKPLENFMKKKLLTIPLALVLVLCVCSVSVFANVSEPATSPEVKATAEKEASKTNAKLKKDMENLLANAKAGKVAPRQQQFPRTARNNLSKTTKIALIATAIGTSIFLIVLFHDLSKD